MREGVIRSEETLRETYGNNHYRESENVAQHGRNRKARRRGRGFGKVLSQEAEQASGYRGPKVESGGGQGLRDENYQDAKHGEPGDARE